MVGESNIYSNVPASLKQIYEAHWETGNEVNSQAGNAIKEAQRDALSSKKTHWHITYENGYRQFVYKNITRPIGDIVNRQGVMIKLTLQNLIQSRTYATKGTTVVTAPMKSGTTEIRRDGRVVDRKRVDSVGKGNIDILQKLNYGLNGKSNKINRVNKSFSWQGEESKSSFEGKHKALNFIEEGRRKALPRVNGYIKNGFKDGLSRRAKTSTKIVKVA